MRGQTYAVAGAKALLNKSFEEVSAFQRALKEFVGSIDATFAKETSDFFIGLEGSFGAKHVTPRCSNIELSS